MRVHPFASGCIVLAVMGCDPGKTAETTTVSTTTTGVTTSEPTTSTTSTLPVWLYEATAQDGTARRLALDNQVVAELTGYTFASQPLGPTLVAEPSQQIAFSLDNRTSRAVELVADGVTLTNSPLIDPGQKASTVMITDLGPGVYAWSMPDQGQGLAGLVTVRDPADFPVEDIETQVNLVLYQAAAEATTLDRCVLDGIVDTGGACPAMEAAAADVHMLLAQRLTQTWTPDNLRHGGPPNEFITSTPGSPRLQLTEGENVRLNVFNMTDTAHELDLSDLPLGTAGAPIGTVDLPAGSGTAFTVEGLEGIGIYPVTCLDCEIPLVATGEIEIVADTP